MARRYFEQCLAFETANNFTVCHETHRGRFLFSPWTTHRFFKDPANADLRKGIKLCADLSHWVNVCETGVEDPILNAVIEDLGDM